MFRQHKNILCILHCQKPNKQPNCLQSAEASVVLIVFDDVFYKTRVYNVTMFIVTQHQQDATKTIT
jgi:hypothetical protein